MHSSIQFYFLYTLIILIFRCRIKIKTWFKTRNYSKMTSYKRMFTIKNPHGPGGVFFAWQRTSGGFLATTGYDQVIHIYNRHADLVEQLRLPGMCSCFGWDKDGDLLAVITASRSPSLSQPKQEHIPGSLSCSTRSACLL